MVYPAIVIFGPPFSGKGTAGAKLAGIESRLYYASSGDMIRAARGTDIGNEMDAYSMRGELSPDELVLRLFRAEITRLVSSGVYTPENVLLLDGIPRTVFQAGQLNGIDCNFLDVFNVANIPDEELTRRALARQRSDDTPENIAKRLAQFRSDTLPVLEYFRASCVPIFDVDGNRPREEVLESLRDRVLARVFDYWP